MQAAEVQVLLHNLQAWIGSPNDADRVTLWTHGLAFAHILYPHLF